MEFTELTHKQLNKFKEQRSKDLSSRSTTGTFIYLLIWMSLCANILIKDGNPVLVDWITNISGILFFVSLLRGLAISISRTDIFSCAIRYYLLIAGASLNALAWGCIVSHAYLDTPLAPHVDLLLLATVGISAGGAMTLSASKLMLDAFILAILGPIAFTQIFFVADTDLEVVTAVFLFIFGLLFSSRQVNREYVRSLSQTIILDDLTTRDQLTSLKNRRHLDDRLQAELHTLVEGTSDNTLSLILLDIDHFKRLNDEYGHVGGDKCLITMGRLLKDVVKLDNATLARFGGEEFAILLPAINKEKCLQLAEKIRSTVESSVVRYQDNKIVYTASLGACTLNHDDAKTCSISEFLDRADQALYKAKENGRNQVVTC